MKYIDCCNHMSQHKKCTRQSDKKIFTLPRRFTRKRCLSNKVRGFSMRSSCAPYKDCMSYRRRKNHTRKRKKSRKTRRKYKK